jgi:hypothetical protein
MISRFLSSDDDTVNGSFNVRFYINGCSGGHRCGTRIDYMPGCVR